MLIFHKWSNARTKSSITSWHLLMLNVYIQYFLKFREHIPFTVELLAKSSCMQTCQLASNWHPFPFMSFTLQLSKSILLSLAYCNKNHIVHSFERSPFLFPYPYKGRSSYPTWGKHIPMKHIPISYHFQRKYKNLGSRW
jgi:hypothetical protein